jgi:hypothetical protein
METEMAHYDAAQDHSTTHAAASLGRILTAPVRGLWHFLLTIAETNAKVRQVERLSAMSDDALSRRGVRREEIVRDVFLGSSYL